MNAETRAKEIVAEFLAATTPETSSPDREWDMVKLIATAIRQAENDKLEEAAQCVRDNCLPAECHYALEAISALKHED